jgi:hypothetical protein
MGQGQGPTRYSAGRGVDPARGRIFGRADALRHVGLGGADRLEEQRRFGGTAPH